MCLATLEKNIENFASFSWQSDEREELLIAEAATSKLTSIAEGFFHAYIQFIISGEFLQHDSLQKTIENFIEICNKTTEDERLLERRDLYSIVYDVSSYFKNWLIQLKRFHFTNTRHFKDRKGQWINDLYRREEPYEPQIIKLKNNSFAIYLIIKVFEIDLQLSPGKNQIAELLSIRSEFEFNSNIKEVILPYRSILIDKINLLINKLTKGEEKEIRFSLEDENFNLREQQTLINYTDADTDLLASPAYSEVYSKIKRIDINNTCSFGDLYVLMKSYKNDIGQIEKANVLLSNIEDRKSNGSTFDQWALDVSYIYIYNNILSLKLRNTSDLSVLKQAFSETIIIQDKKDVWNYYPFLKLAKRVNSLISDLFNEEYVSNSDIKEHIEFLDKCIEALKRCYLWSSERLNWPYQPVLRDCIKEIGEQELKVFTAASFVVPINYQKVKEQIDELKDSLANHKELRSSLLLIEKEKIKIIAETTKKADERILFFQDQNQGLLRQNIEILSIFAAIVLFVMGNIQIYSQVDTLNSAIAFTLAFGYVIAVFILLISLIIRSNKEQLESKRYKIRVLWFLVISAIIFICIIFCAPNLPISSSKNHNANKETTIQQNVSHETPNSISATSRKK